MNFHFFKVAETDDIRFCVKNTYVTVLVITFFSKCCGEMPGKAVASNGGNMVILCIDLLTNQTNLILTTWKIAAACKGSANVEKQIRIQAIRESCHSQGNVLVYLIAHASHFMLLLCTSFLWDLSPIPRFHFIAQWPVFCSFPNRQRFMQFVILFHTKADIRQYNDYCSPLWTPTCTVSFWQLKPSFAPCLHLHMHAS